MKNVKSEVNQLGLLGNMLQAKHILTYTYIHLFVSN